MVESTSTVTWDRRIGIATIIGETGNGLTYQEVSGNTRSDGSLPTAHFYGSKAARKFTGKATREAKYGGWTRGPRNSFRSINGSGGAAFANHTIGGGKVKVLISEGYCDIEAIDPKNSFLQDK